MKDAFLQLLSSRKALVSLLAMVAIVVLASLGKVTSDQAVDFVKWVVSAWLAAQAYESGKVKVAALATPPKPSADDP